jgi:tetratricopeptide (TPR) repeat protein
MTAPASPQAIFGAAEQAFTQGRFEEARAHLSELRRIGLDHPAVHHLTALVERRLGNLDAAARAFEAAARLAPGDPQIANNHGNLLGDLGDGAGALAAYERALSLAPDCADAALNRAIALHRLKRFAEARAALTALAATQPGNIRLWNALGALERDARDLAASAAAYDRALALKADHRLATRGRARVAAERGESDVLARYAAARAIAPDDRALLMEETEARADRGDTAGLAALADRVKADRDWTEGQLALARIRWEAGEAEGFTAELDAALQEQPKRRDLWIGLIDLLSGAGRIAEAADAARAAHLALGEADLRLLEATHASRSGDLEGAEALFAALPSDMPGRAALESGHRVRRGELGRAAGLIDRALAEDPLDMGSWAVAELVYRATDDPRAGWLSGQEGLVRPSQLALDSRQMEALRRLLLELHASGAEMIGQSVRDGTQTRGALFQRPEPELAELRRALEDAIEDYVRGLPPLDPAHPLLRHRATPLGIIGSWSVRLTGSGYHVSHFHPNGLVSSACYFIVPETAATSREGWLELGRPPPELRLDLEPLTAIEPMEGRLVLFPSYLHHGTRPFSAGERLTVAFDVAAAER